jgi:mannosyltransferase
MTGNRTTKPGGWIWLGLLLLAAGILRFYKLNSPLWLDEVVALVQSYREPFWQILTKFPGHFPHPLYGQLAHGSLSVFGESAFSIRLPAALFGIAGIFYFYRFSRRFSGHGEALLGAALFAVSYHHIYFSQDARGYTVYLLLALIATGLLLDILDRMRWSASLAYVVAAVLAAYAQTAGLILPPAQVGLSLVIVSITPKTHRPNGARARQLIFILGLTILFALLLYGPILRDSLTFASHETLHPSGTPDSGPVGNLLAEFLNGLKSSFANWPVLVAAGLVGVVGLVNFGRRHSVALALLTVPMLLLAVIATITSVPMHARYFLLLLIPGYLVGTRGIVWISKKIAEYFPRWDRVQTPAAVALVILAALPLRNYYSRPKQDFPGALGQAREMAGPNGRVIGGTMSGHIYRIYYAPDLPVIKNLSDLLAEEATGQALWVIMTFERIEATYRPDLLAHLHNDYKLARVLPASTGDGEMRIYARPAQPAVRP